MSDLTVKYIAGQFSDPNQDNYNKLTPNQNGTGISASLQDNMLTTYLSQQAKGLTKAAVSRIGATTGNRTMQRNLEYVSEIAGDIGTILVGASTGGLIGAGVATVAVGVQRGIKAYDIQLEYRKDSLDAQEIARKFGFIKTDKTGVFR